MKEYIDSGKKDTRSGFGAGLAQLGNSNPKVLALTADLKGSLKMDQFAAEHPDRFFDVGIAEANMVGMAAGMALSGYIPFIGTFANFATARVLDQIRQSICYSRESYSIELLLCDLDYFDFFPTRFLSGSREVLQDNTNAMISESFAKKIGYGRDAVGKHFILDSLEYTIEGIVPVCLTLPRRTSLSRSARPSNSTTVPT